MKKTINNVVKWVAITFLITGFILIETPVKKPVSKKEEIKGAIEYLAGHRVDLRTGKLEQKYIYQALRQIEQLSAKRSSSLGLKWKELGPDNVGGRTRAILIDKDNRNKVYAGGVGGGLWVSEDGGSSWSNVESFDDFLTVSSICQTLNGNIYVGTGEGFYYNFGTGVGGLPGNGIYKSSNGGKTFNNLSATSVINAPSINETWSHVNALAADQIDSNTVYAATNRGLWMSQNGGADWEKPEGALTSSSAQDVEVAADNTIYASIGNKFYRSVDNGANFKNLSNDYGSSANGPLFNSRLKISPSPLNSDVVYAITVDSDETLQYVYKSNDKGTTWDIIAEESDFDINWGGGSYNQFGGQGTYNLAIAASANDADQMFIGGQYSSQKWNSSSWERLSNAYGTPYVHADLHEIVVDQKDPSTFYIGCDGGVFKTTDGGASFSHTVKGYNTVQFYGLAASPEGKVTAGAQDNGSHLLSPDDSMGSHKILGADGGYTEISHIDPTVYFAASQYGNLYRSNQSGMPDTYNEFYDNNILGTGNPGSYGFANFVTPFRLWEDVSTQKNFFAVGLNGSVWLTKDALNFSKTPVWFRIASISGEASSMEFSPDGDVLFVGTEGGRLYRISGLSIANYTYSGNSWDANSEGIRVANVKTWFSQAVTGIAIDHSAPDNLVITLGNYGNSDYVYRTINALDSNSTDVSFYSIQNDLPQMPVYDAVIDRYNNSNIILATEFGIYTSENRGVNWSEDNNGIGKVATFMLRQYPHHKESGEYIIYAATHGRGVFKYDPLDTATSSIEPYTLKKKAESLVIYPNPVMENAKINLPDEFIGKEAELVIINIEGRVISRKAFNTKSSYIPLKVNDLASGTYLIRIRNSENKVGVGKVNIIR